MRTTDTARSRSRLVGLLASAIGAVLGVASLGAGAQTIAAPGLRAPGSITYDAEGVPVIQAANDLDASFLLGYAHARDRFFQMDFTRRGASGTVAEIVGIAGLANDVQIRTLGLRRAAFATWEAMSPDTKGWLKAYADGVNLWLRTNPLPPEYGALEITKAEPWSPVDSLVIGKALAFQLSFDLDTDLTLRLGAYQQAGTRGNFNGTALFFEDTHRSAPPDNRVSIPGFQPSGGAIAELAGKSVSDEIPMIPAATTELARQYREKVADHPLIGPALRRREERGASNWWIIGGGKTDTGKPILANDPHLGLDTPATFMEVHVVSAESRDGAPLNVVGASAPGTPAVLLGCTERVCWGLTTNPLDVTDTYEEQLVLNTYGLPTHTIYQGRYEPVQFILQSYFVNQLDGTPDNPVRDRSIGYLNGAATILVPRRNNGPLVTINGTTGLSVQYTGWGATFELEAFRRINRAQNLEQFRGALQYFDVGSQNFAYADIDGNIAYFTSAEMPIREDLQTLNRVDGRPPFLIRDGSGTSKNEWLPVANRQSNQAIPYEILKPSEMPFVINPEQGYIANANNDPIGTTLDNNPLNQVRPGGGLYYLNVGYTAYRVGRIDRLIRSRTDTPTRISELDIRRWQANNSLLDAELLSPQLIFAHGRGRTSTWPQLAQVSDTPAVVEAIERIKGWDVVCDVQPPFATPTGIQAGWDAGDNPTALAEPTECEISRSVAATIFSAWRGQVVRNVVDATLDRVGLATALPDSDQAYDALKNLLDTFPQRRGTGAGGVNFFQVQGAPTPEDARDYLLVKSLKDALDLLASESFAPAFNRSTTLRDYRWGRLHRIVFDHPLGGPFNIPGPNPYPFTAVSPQLPGLARGGGFEAVDASSHSARANTLNGFMFGSGPARRFVGEMTTPVVARQILPGGQSGVIGGAGYVSQLSRWLTNLYKPMNIPVATATANPAATLSFAPGQ